MKLAVLKPEPAPLSGGEVIQWIPPHLCFAQLAELPAELPAAEVRAYAELTIEGGSPYPLEQLAWGYWPSPRHQQLWLAAVPSFRLAQEKLTLDPQAEHVVPGYLAAGDAPESGPVVRCLHVAGSVCAVRLVPGNPLPQAVRAVPLPAEPDAKTLAQAREQALAGLPGGLQGATVEVGLWSVGPVEAHKELGAVWTLQRGEDVLTFSPTWRGENASKVDLRDEATLKALRRSQQLAGYVSLATVAAVVLFGIALFLQLATWGLSAWNDSRSHRIVQQMKTVDLIVQQELLTERIQASSRAGLRPFHMLELINISRPAELYFERVVSKDEQTLEITGKADSVNRINNYVADLRSLPFITSAESTPNSSASGAEFRLTVVFSDVPNSYGDPAAPALAQQP